MNTEDRVMAVLARANPMPEDDSLELSTDAVTYLATLEQRSSEMTQIDTRPAEVRKPSRSRLVAVAAGVVVVVGAALVLLTRNDKPPVVTQLTSTTLATPTTIPEATQELSPQLEEALAVATAFNLARADMDIEGMSESGIEGHVNGFFVSSLETIPDEFDWLMAVGWTTEVQGCEITNPDLTGTTVRCDVTHSDALSDALDQGPYEGAYHMRVGYAGDEKLGVTINETTVTESLFMDFPSFQFTSGTWRPFVTWLEDNHPEDVSSMFAGEVQSNDIEFLLRVGERKPSLSEESVALWAQYTAEFVAEVGGG